MQLTRRVAYIVASLCLAPLLLGEPALARNCMDPVRKTITDAGWDLKDTKGVRFFTRRRGGLRGRRDVIIGYDAWVKFKTCDGNLVVVLNNLCGVQTSYWKGGCAPKKGSN